MLLRICGRCLIPESICWLTFVLVNMESAETAEEKTSSISVAQRRAEIRRRKLLMNSEDRMNRIVGYAKNESENNGMRRDTIAPAVLCMWS